MSAHVGSFNPGVGNEAGACRRTWRSEAGTALKLETGVGSFNPNEGERGRSMVAVENRCRLHQDHRWLVAGLRRLERVVELVSQIVQQAVRRPRVRTV